MKQKLSQLELIFAAADVLDIDLSRWREFVAMYCVADHLQVADAHAPPPVMRIEFRRPQVCNIELPTMQGEDGNHPAWSISACEISDKKPVRLVCWGPGWSPRITIVCDTVVITESDGRMFKAICPDAFALHRRYGLARPSVEYLFEQLRAKKRRNS